MKKIYAILFFAFVGINANSQTTVTNGNASNPATWGGTLPTGTGTVIINHAVTLDVNYNHTSGSITINAGGSLTGNSSSRVFSLNYPSGTATLTVNGSFNVARVPLISGTVSNSGTFQADSLLNSSTFTNNSGATITASQFLNNAGGTINNNTNSSITSINFLNVNTVTNAGTMTITDFTNSKSFTNTTTGIMSISNNFANMDTLASPTQFTNNGSVTVSNDWYNKNIVDGSTGKFCVGNYSLNDGSMTGTFDFCDQTGGSIDLNNGTIAPSITYCTFACGTGLEELLEVVLINAYPNPFSAETSLQLSKVVNAATLVVYNSFGQEVKQLKNIDGQTIILQRDNLPNGLYFLRLMENNKVLSVNKLVINN